MSAAPSLFPVIIGPTAGGKSDLAVALALHMQQACRVPAEVVTADSIQIYRGLDIGSAKPTRAERRGVAHRLIDIVEPNDAFSVHQWLRLANAEIERVRHAGGLPIVVGGTHLYVKALLDGLFEGPDVDPVLRESLRATELSTLRAELERVDPAAAAKINAADHRRTARALEVFRQTGRPISELQTQWDREDHRRRDCVLIGLRWPIEAINRRINARVKLMIEQGLVDEARALWAQGRLGVQAREALGYKQLIEHFEGRCTLEEAVEKVKIETRRFAKNQRTWLKRLATVRGAVWIDMPADPQAMVGMVLEACAAAPAP